MDYTKRRSIDLPAVREIRTGDVFSNGQAAKIGWKALQNIGLQFDCLAQWQTPKNERRWTVHAINS